jgi:predicted oxidoreductase
MIWSPLGGGRLFDGSDVQAARVWAVLQDLAAQHGVSVPTVAYAWILRHPSRPIPVTGTGRLEGLRDAVAALDVRLSAQAWYRVWQASIGHEVP